MTISYRNRYSTFDIGRSTIGQINSLLASGAIPKGHTVHIANIPHITASQVTPPPPWAQTQRRLFSVMEEAARLTAEKYCDRGGVPYFADDVDDLYERFYNWGLFYSMGASEEILALALRAYNAITRSNDDRTHNPLFPWLFPQIHNEYYSLTVPPGMSPSWIPGQRIITDWHHMGEGNQLFYNLGLGDPTIAENVQRAQRFAAMMIGADLEAPNYDANLNQFRSVYTDARGPIFEVNVEQVKGFLHGGSPTQPNWSPKPMPSRIGLYPAIKELKIDWYKNPQRAREVVDIFNKVVMRGDTPANLAATGLVTNAYLYTGDDTYKQWVLRYTEGWIDRMRNNGGIMPDNIGPSGKIGEYRDGVWWGGWYGWDCYKGMNIGLTSITIAAQCAQLLSGDAGYLEILRTQMEHIVGRTQKKDSGQVLYSWRRNNEEWFDYKEMPPKWLPHLYHASMATADYQLVDTVRHGDVEHDWGETEKINAKTGGNFAFFHYHDGKFSSWPNAIMKSELDLALTALEHVKQEPRTRTQMLEQNTGIPNPVMTEGLTQMMLGAPGTVYNGGLLRATVRYYDADLKRPGLPQDVAAFVDKLGPETVGVQLVNLSQSQSRRVIVQSGAFAEHQFTEIEYVDDSIERTVPADSKYIEVTLPPSTTIGMECGLKRFVNRPSYAFPWHGDIA